MRKFYVIMLILISISCYAQDKMLVFKKGGIKTETLTSSIDSITYPNETVMRIHNWNASITDIPLAEIDSIKLIPDQGTSKTDRDALIALYNATDGPNWTNNTNWCSDKPLNEWFGININSRGRVDRIDLTSNQLKGSIPPELGGLSKLEWVYLLNNQLSGDIPPQLGQLSNLQYLLISSNQLSGFIPIELGKLKNLITLHLGDNQLKGNIPIEFSHLNNLKMLNLVRNQITGTIPPELSKLSKLESLYLSDNQLSGNIPSELGQLTTLLHLDLSSNLLSGTIPPELVQIPNLHQLLLQKNIITGTVPNNFGKVLTNVSKFSIVERNYDAGINISSNRLSGVLPYALVSHPNWNEFSRLIVPQQQGFEFEPATVKLDNFTAKDIYGKIVDSRTLLSQNKITIIHHWSATCVASKAFIPELKNIYQTYSSKGLGVVSFHGWFGGDEQSARDYISKNQMNWINVIEGSPFSNSQDNLIPFLQGITTPSVDIINQHGEVIFSNHLWNDLSEIEEFIASQLGLGPIELYESKDFTKDGIVTQLQSATIGKGVNVILMGDGFVDTTFVSGGLYEKRMHEAMEHFFSVEPTKSYRKYFNVYVVNAVSKNGVFQDNTQTVFGSKFEQESTAVSSDIGKIKQYAQKVEGIQSKEPIIVTVLNSPRYAGICYMFDDASISFVPIVAFDPKEFAAVIQHEAIGHGLGKLGDEYTFFKGTINQAFSNDLKANQSKGWFQNLSLSTSDLPWQHFLGKPNYSMVSAYEGGYYFSNGVWRPEQNSCMNDNVAYFNAPSRELIVKRILNSAGINYSWNDFILNDKYEPILKSASISTLAHKKEFEHLPSPVVMNKKLFE